MNSDISIFRSRSEADGTIVETDLIYDGQTLADVTLDNQDTKKLQWLFDTVQLRRLFHFKEVFDGQKAKSFEWFQWFRHNMHLWIRLMQQYLLLFNGNVDLPWVAKGTELFLFL